MKYKYTATYKKDETGSFKEQSKIIFENKNDIRQTMPLRPKPPLPPPPPPPLSPHPPSSLNIQSNWNEPVIDFQSSESAKNQLAMALEALRNNSKKLESKLDKIEDVTPVSNVYNEPVVKKNKNDEEIKKKNDSFFNDILTKSDDLITQTQQKLDRLNKLDSAYKSNAPTKPMAPIVDKPKPSPVPSPIPSSSPSPSPSPNFLPADSSLMPNSSNINNSASLIDLKSFETPLANEPNSHTSLITTDIDILFDSNENTFSLNAEPLKTGESYFDLIGISSNSAAVNNSASNSKSLPRELLTLNLEDPTSSSKSVTPISSPYKVNLSTKIFI